MGKTEIDVMPSAYFALAAGFLLLPLNWLLSAVIAAGFHECCHLIGILCCRVPVYRVRIDGRGATIETGFMTPGMELFCAAAGPVGSLCLLTVIRKYPLLGLLGLAQGLFNLLPIYPLDGGRILRSIFMLAKSRL